MANDIEPSKEFYTAVRAPAPIVVDGNLSEWAGAPVLSDPRFSVCPGAEGSAAAEGCGDAGELVLFEKYQGGDWTGPNDHTSAVQVVYDNDNIYFGFVVTDEYHENAANSAWNGDSVQLMVANAARTTEFALYNYALGGVEGATLDVIVNHERGGAALEECACATTGIVRRDAVAKKTYYEIKLPAAAVGLTPPLTAGMKFGLGMAINDGDEATPGQKGWGGLGVHSIVYNGKDPTETALVTLGASQTTTEILGVGAESLLTSDLTDPQNDGVEADGPTSPTWNWVGITSSHEPSFDNGEAAFNIFDNLVGGGNDKWCCDDPTPAAPVWVAVQFANPVSLTHFTVTSGNDAADRDPIDWAIQGSADGASYTDIYRFNATPALWTERNQVIKFTLPSPSAPYRYIRYIANHTPGTLHQLNEVEYFGTIGSSDRMFLSAINGTFEGFSFRATDAGTSIVAPATAKLTLDGQVVPLTNVKTGDATDFTYKPAAPLPPNSEHTYSIEVRDTLGNIVTSTGTFRTIAFALLTAVDRVTADTTKPGFIWRVHQNQAFTATVNSRTLDQLAGLLGENFADPAAQGPALAPGVPGANNRLPITFEIPTVINLNQDAAAEQNGDIVPDDQMPGIPGTTASTDGIAAEIITYIDLPAGKHTLIVNSDDAFRTTAGKIDDLFQAQVAGEFNAGRGAADTAYTVFVQDAGVYPFRTLYNEGGVGANIEWKFVKSDGTEVLINDRANGGLSAYRAATGGPATVITSVSPAVNNNKVVGSAPIEVTIREGATTVDTASLRFVINGTEVTPTFTRSGSIITARHQPTTAFAANTTNTVVVNFTHGGTARTANWSFSVPRTTLDEISNRPAFILGSANFTGDAGGRTGQAGDRGMDFGMGTATPSVLVPDATFLNAETADDTLTFSIWVKKADLANNSAFWADSPSSPSSQRGFQGHVPWSDNNVYFDSAGCCAAEETRISAPIDTAPGYTGPEWVTNRWHHWVFMKDAATKRIYIDGQLFLEGGGTTPLPTDFTRIWLGAEGGGANNGVANNIHGVIDDFSAFGTALSAADVGRLFSGTLPSALGAATRPLAHWDFNEAPAAARPQITSITRAANGSITVVWTGTGQLEAAPAVTGPWQAVTGATTGTYTFTPAAGQNMLFGRIRAN
jgi:hypothetical protein